MKIISFLGTGKYHSTTYLHPCNSQEKETRFFQEALVEFYQPKTLFVFLTPTVAKHSNWAELQACLSGKVDLKPIENIPESNSPDDGWIIFDKMTGCLNEGDRVIFDLTHSFRCIPVVALLAISYLRTVKQVNIEGLLYGAFDPNAQGQPTPTYDLLPMLSLLDWISATDRFVKVGDGTPLAELLRNAIPGLERRNDPSVRPLASQLDQLSRIIAQISQAIALARPLETLDLTVQLEEILQQAGNGIHQRAKPFSLVSDQLLQAYGQFALPDSMISENIARNLWLQFQMIEWYMQRGQVVQAMTLAREWLISVTAYHLGVTHLLESRNSVSLALNNGLAVLQNREPATASNLDSAFQELADYQDYSNLWGQLSEIRNDLAHVGMRRNYRPGASLQRQAQQRILPRLRQIAQALL